MSVEDGTRTRFWGPPRWRVGGSSCPQWAFSWSEQLFPAEPHWWSFWVRHPSSTGYSPSSPQQCPPPCEYLLENHREEPFLLWNRGLLQILRPCVYQEENHWEEMFLLWEQRSEPNAETQFIPGGSWPVPSRVEQVWTGYDVIQSHTIIRSLIKSEDMFRV